jgi:hypothetical protein
MRPSPFRRSLLPTTINQSTLITSFITRPRMNSPLPFQSYLDSLLNDLHDDNTLIPLPPLPSLADDDEVDGDSLPPFTRWRSSLLPPPIGSKDVQGEKEKDVDDVLPAPVLPSTPSVESASASGPSSSGGAVARVVDQLVK